MKIAPTLSLYLARQFLTQVLMALGVLSFISFIFEIVELLRKTSKMAAIPFSGIVEMAALRLPQSVQQLMIFAILFAAMHCFFRLTRNQELVIVRTAGVSVWGFLWPMMVSVLLLGIIKITIINPISAVMLARYEQLDSSLAGGSGSAINIAGSGLWLRQQDATGRDIIIHARSVNREDGRLADLTLFFSSGPDQFDRRIDASQATLADGAWHIPQGFINEPGLPAQPSGEVTIPTDLSLGRIEESFAEPETISFWQIPGFIQMMEATGFAATRLRLHFLSLLSQPFLFAGVLLLATAMSLRPSREGGAGKMAAGGTLLGFLLYFINDVVQALGMHDNLPLFLAAWAPAGLALLLGSAALLHLEDG
ncbi:MAG: LPS export ABC transporter permease LptG [Alphaproteobacteria bacterium GWF2_58_20]|nr:MAG: LPS export ABC transporter permease LptG [Alphaproteobacteria bacterium GWF2_58_20]